MVIDTAGVVKDKYKRYFAYGGGAIQTVSTGQKYQYTGQPYDDDGAFDLYYYGARYYDPVIGRFTSRDPKAGKYPSLGTYSYALDNLNFEFRVSDLTSPAGQLNGEKPIIIRI
jgi:RHS repeat-associated protein